MTLTPAQREKLDRLLFALRDDELTRQQAAELEQLVLGNPEAMRHYLRVANLNVSLRWMTETEGGPPDVGPAVELPNLREDACAGIPRSTIHNRPSFAPPIVVDISPAIDSSLAGQLFSPGGFLFSYTMSALIVGIALLIGWTWRISCRQLVVQQDVRQPDRAAGDREAAQRVVGRITGIVDCQWSDPRDGSATCPTAVGAPVALGRKYALASGFVEITYDSGAKVLIEGPASYEVASASSGFLSLGKLTARVEHQGSGAGGPGSGSKGERTANLALSQDEREPTVSLAPRPSLSRDREAAGEKGEERREKGEGASGQWSVVSGRNTDRGNLKSQIPNQQIPSPLSPLPSPLFSVRTPTAVVTDLGTEFGVEVSTSGATKSHVFRGKVKLQLVEEGRPDAEPILLGENEEADVGAGPTRSVKVIHEPSLSNRRQFARQMPQPVRINLFNTGIGLREGDPDPHWQLAARSDDPNFQPRPAIVTSTAVQYLPNDPAHSEWISMAAGLPHLPEGVTFTFRTTFELAGVSPEWTVLRGGFIADNHVDAIRLNGQPASVPQHGYGYDEDLFLRFHPLTIDKGFAAGTNVLEIDVFNGDPKSKRFYPNRVTPMALRVELQGFALRGGGLPATTTGGTPPASGRKEANR